MWIVMLFTVTEDPFFQPLDGEAASALSGGPNYSLRGAHNLFFHIFKGKVSRD